MYIVLLYIINKLVTNNICTYIVTPSETLYLYPLLWRLKIYYGDLIYIYRLLRLYILY